MSRPWRNGELAPSACSSGRWRRSAVEGADRGLGVGHPDVDVQAADRVGDRVAEQVADALVALLVGDLGVALGARPDACRRRAARRRSR